MNRLKLDRAPTTTTTTTTSASKQSKQKENSQTKSCKSKIAIKEKLLSKKMTKIPKTTRMIVWPSKLTTFRQLKLSSTAM